MKYNICKEYYTFLFTMFYGKEDTVSYKVVAEPRYYKESEGRLQ